MTMGCTKKKMIRQKKTNDWTKTMNETRTVEVAIAMMTFVQVGLLVQDGIQVRTKTTNRKKIMTTVFVCAIQPILEWELAVTII